MYRRLLLESIENLTRDEKNLKKTAFFDKRPDGTWEKTSYEDFLVSSFKYYEIFIEHEISGKRILVFSNLLLDSYFIDYANYFCKNIAAYCAPKASLEEIEHTLDDLKAEVILALDADVLKRISGKIGLLKNIKTVITINDVEDKNVFQNSDNHIDLLSLKNLFKEKSAKTISQISQTYKKIAETVSENDIAFIQYTSGTSSFPKGVVHTQRSFYPFVKDNCKYFFAGEGYVNPIFSPPYHSLGRMYPLAMVISLGTCVIVKNVSELFEIVKEFNVDAYMLVPRFHEKILENVLHRHHMENPVVNIKLDNMIKTFGVFLANTFGHKKMFNFLPGAYLLFARMYFKSVRSQISKNLKATATGSAFIPKNVEEEYFAYGIPLMNVYGATEVGLLSSNKVKSFKFGTIGKFGPDIKYKIDEETKELFISCEGNMKGYLEDINKGRDSFVDNYFPTGDEAEEDNDGFITVKGRIKDFIVTSYGINIFPYKIEEMIKDNPLVSNTIVIGNSKPFLTLFVFLVKGTDIDGLEESFLDYMHGINQRLSKREKIQKVTIFARDLSIDNKELTSLLKVRRSFVLEKYSEYVDRMYSDREKKLKLFFVDDNFKSVL